MTTFITMDEFNNTKIACLDDAVYKRIERAFIDVLGYTIAKNILTRFAEKTVREFTTNSMVDVMSAITIY